MAFWVVEVVEKGEKKSKSNQKGNKKKKLTKRGGLSWGLVDWFFFFSVGAGVDSSRSSIWFKLCKKKRERERVSCGKPRQARWTQRAEEEEGEEEGKERKREEEEALWWAASAQHSNSKKKRKKRKEKYSSCP